MDAQPANLPPLRDELTLHPGPVGVDGAPTWTLHDPLRNQFFRLAWPAFEILERWDAGDPQVVAELVSAETALDIGPEDVGDVAEFLARSQLLKSLTPADTQRLLSIAEGAKGAWTTWLLHHYLFFRIPLVRPDRVLSKALPLVRWLGSRRFRLATLAALIVGLFLIGRQWNTFTTTLVDHLSVTGIASFGVALALAKVVHELGHAFAAKSMGCRVPTMGAAFLVMWPVLYTDVNEAWKLTDRGQRVMVGAAGILAELSLAAWATLAWGLLPEGTARAMAFTLAATTLVSSLAINLSPFMRFDGYFLVMDWLDMPNLHTRAFALARWWMRETLFDLREPIPERFPPRRHAFLIVFAFGIWLYRLTLFLGIAVLVYHFFIKVVGIFLFAVEVGWFVIKPVMMEVKEWRARSDVIVGRPRSRITFAVLAALIFLAVAPWSGRVSAPALLKASDHVVFYAPSPAILSKLAVHEGQTVLPGAIIAELSNPDLDYRLAQVGRRITVLRYELNSIGFDESFRGRSQAIASELESALAEQMAEAREKARLILETSIGGVVTDVSTTLQLGQWINPRESILGVRDTSAVLVEGYVSEDDLPRISTGMSAVFLPEGGNAAIPATLVSIDRTAVRNLSDPSLAVPFGGPIPARMDKQTLAPDAAIYRVRLSVPENATENLVDASVVLRGEVHIAGERRSLLGRAFRAAAAVVIREWGT